MAEYYIPSIVEFHPGFEYEMLNKNDQWIKHVCGKSWKHVMQFLKESHKIRVKYLDEKDINYLGWYKEDDNFWMLENNNGYWELWIDDSVTPVLISVHHSFRKDQHASICMNHIVCYNKSELCFWMKRLGIIDINEQQNLMYL